MVLSDYLIVSLDEGLDQLLLSLDKLKFSGYCYYYYYFNLEF